MPFSFALALALSCHRGEALRAQAPATNAAPLRAVSLLPPVSISTGIWMQRGFEQERARVVSEVSSLQEELLRNAREQQTMSSRLRDAEQRLRKAGEETALAQSMAKEIAGARGELELLRKAMSELENQSIAKEREYMIKLESAAGERGALEARLKDSADRLATQANAVVALRRQVEEGADQAQKSQARMAEFQQRLADSGKERERATALVRQIDEINAGRKAELAALRQNLATALAEPELANGNFTNLQMRVAAMTENRRKLEEEIEGKEAALQQAALRLVEREKSEKTLKESMERLAAEREEMARRQAEQASALADAAERQKNLLVEREKTEGLLVAERENLSQQVAAKELVLAEQARQQEALQSKLADLDRLGLTLQEQQRQSGLLQASLKQVETDRASLTQQTQALRGKLGEMEEQKQNLRTEAAALEANREALRKELDAKQAQIARQETDLTAERERAEGIRKARAELELRMGGLEQQLAAEKKRADELTALTERQKMLREEITKLTQNLEKTETGSKQQTETLAAVMAERDKLKTLAQDYERTNVRQQQELEKQKILLQDIRETMAFAEKQSAALGAGTPSGGPAMARVAELQEEVLRQKSALEGASRNRADLERKIMEMEGEIGRMKSATEDPAMESTLKKELDAARVRMNDLQQKLDEREKTLQAAQTSRAEANRLMRDIENGLPAGTRETPPDTSESLRKEKEALEKILREREEELLRFRAAAAMAAPPATPPAGNTPASALPAVPGPVSPEFTRRLDEAARLMEENKLPAAAAALDAALAAQPGQSDALYRRAVVKYQLGRFAESRADIDAVLATLPAHGASLGLLALIQWSTGDLPRARDAITRALAAQPDNPQLYNHQGIILNSLNDFAGAIAALETAVRMEPGNAESLFNLAALIVSHEPARKEEARRHYEAALKLGLTRDEQLEKRLYE